MSELTAEVFAQRAFDAGLLDERQLDIIWSELGSHDVPSSKFRSAAVRRELLTNYQCDRLERGERSGYFHGDYKILYLVGTGTFARVYRAADRYSGKVVAVKVLRSRFSKDPAQTDQFLREGEMGAELRHPSIVPIYEVHSEKNAHFLVMDFVEGRNLRDFVKVRGKLDPVEATALITDVVSGLDYAGLKGLTHRDLKMSNILVTSRGKAKLVDFGLANVRNVSDESLDDCPNPRTIDYAALEKLTGVKRDDPRSDIYFVGCIYYNMLSGHPPLFETKDRVQRLSATRFEEIIPIMQHVPMLPVAVAAIVNKAMELKPDRRYSTPGEMLRDLKMVAGKLASGDTAEMPAASEDAAEGSARSAAPSKIQASRSVMVVESRVEMQDIFRDQLKKHGYRVLIMSDPQRALARYQQEDEAPPADCIVFSAISLGEESVEAFQRFSSGPLTEKLPAALLLDAKQKSWAAQIGPADPATAENAAPADHRAVVVMPVRMKEFCQTLEKLLAAAAAK